MTLLSPVFYLSCLAEDDIDLLVTQLDKISEQDQDDNDVKKRTFSLFLKIILF
jgi:hypothetical protein